MSDNGVEVPVVNLTLDADEDETISEVKREETPRQPVKREIEEVVEKPLQRLVKQPRTSEQGSHVILVSSGDEEDVNERNKSGKGFEASLHSLQEQLLGMTKKLRAKKSMKDVLSNKLARRKDFEDTLHVKYRSLLKLYGEDPNMPSQRRLLSDLRLQIQSAEERTVGTRTKLHVVRKEHHELEKKIKDMYDGIRSKSNQDSTAMSLPLQNVPKDVVKDERKHELFVETINKVRNLLKNTSRPEDNKIYINRLCDRLQAFENEIFYEQPSSVFLKATIFQILTELTNQGIKMPFIFQRFKELRLYDEEIPQSNEVMSTATKFEKHIEQVFTLADKLNRPEKDKSQIKHYASIVLAGFKNNSQYPQQHPGKYHKITHALLRLKQLGVRIPFVMEEMKKLNYDIQSAIDSPKVFHEIQTVKSHLLQSTHQNGKAAKISKDLDLLQDFLEYYLEGEEVFDPEIVRNIFKLMVHVERLEIGMPLTKNAMYKLGLNWDDFIDADYFLLSLKKMRHRLQEVQSSRSPAEMLRIYKCLDCLASFIERYQGKKEYGISSMSPNERKEVCHAAHILYSLGILLVYCNESLSKLGFDWKYYPEESLNVIELAKDILQRDSTKTIHEKGNLLTLLQTLEKGLMRAIDMETFSEMKIESFKLTLATIRQSGCKMPSVELTYQSIIEGTNLKPIRNFSSNKSLPYNFKRDVEDKNAFKGLSGQPTFLSDQREGKSRSVIFHQLQQEIEEAILSLSNDQSLDKMAQDTIVSALSNILSFLKISQEFTAVTVPSMWRSTVQMSIDVLDRFLYVRNIPLTLDRLSQQGFVIPEQYINDDDLTVFGQNIIKTDDFVTYNSEADDDIDEVLEHYKTRVDQSLRMTNIYNTEDASSLRDLLEGLKEIETEVEGEDLTPNELTVNLLKHQRQGLRWLTSMEKSSKKGGLLADDMGLGKTVQSLALIMANKPESGSPIKTTLVVAPVAVLRVWKDEVAVKIKKDADVKVVIFGGGENNSSKFKSWEDLAKFDIVLISYQTLASELKKHWPLNWKDGEKQPGVHAADIKLMNQVKENYEYFSPFYRNDSEFYRVILDEAQNIKNKNTQAAKACCTISSTYRWALSGTPIQNNIGELYSLIRFLRIPPYNKEAKFHSDIGAVLNTKKPSDYNDSERQRAVKKVQVLLRAIMLRRTKTSQLDGKPILQLPDKHVKELAGTLQDEEHEFYQALESKSQDKAKKMLQSKQKQGAYSSILTLLLRLRQACLHSELVRIGESKAESSKIVNGKDFEKDWKPLYLAAKKLGQNQTSINTVNTCLDDMTCPVCMEQMDIDSMIILSACGHCMCAQCFDTYVDNAKLEPGASLGPKGTNSVNVPCLVCKKINNDKQAISYQLYDQANNLHYSMEDLKLEYNKVIEEQKARLKNGYKIDYDKLKVSKKVEMCLEIIEKTTSANTDEKLVIFSQFTMFFEILGHFITKTLGLKFLRYDGTMSSSQRAACIETFYQNNDSRVMLISMKAGNSGLTLTCANHVILADPFWNPFVEDQAMDRCHRISQEREVFVHRLLIKSSVEDRIVELQNKKKTLVNLAMDPTQIREVNKLGRKELGFLFGLNSLE
ncbi:unnamed protein product [Kluyveromyces dobzhanskii CBS 2104]|uniref:WGS project CCBQ000000000 data, contig 00272 n=1 Tax=Kluyveromyces dobzhanskii CBS 2104 TaxID=1427455 RepID=A0A0A8L8X1_9SACH|nr:unnamed protein product [Kluyveromyces dobzhanskii CBS 2104]